MADAVKSLALDGASVEHIEANDRRCYEARHDIGQGVDLPRETQAPASDDSRDQEYEDDEARQQPGPQAQHVADPRLIIQIEDTDACGDDAHEQGEVKHCVAD